MTAREALADSRLADAVALQTAVVDSAPDDPAARLFLFELLVLSDELAAARDHLDRIESGDPTWSDTRRRFLHLLRAEGRRSPHVYRPRFLTRPPVHIKRRWNATRAHRLASEGRAAYWLDGADADTPEVKGFVDGRAFVGLRDTDDRFAAQFELFVNGRYVWVAFEQVRTLRIRPAEGVSDIAFREGDLVLADGRTLAVVVPTRYPGSAEAGDDYALAEAADWSDDGGIVCGVGAKVLTFGEEDAPLSECRMIEIR